MRYLLSAVITEKVRYIVADESGLVLHIETKTREEFLSWQMPDKHSCASAVILCEDAAYAAKIPKLDGADIFMPAKADFICAACFGQEERGLVLSGDGNLEVYVQDGREIRTVGARRPPFWNAGGVYSIGCLGLQAAMETKEHIGVPSRLLRDFENRCGKLHMPDAKHIADMAEIVFLAQGDARADEILEDALNAMKQYIFTAAAYLDEKKIPVRVIGYPKAAKAYLEEKLAARLGSRFLAEVLDVPATYGGILRAAERLGVHTGEVFRNRFLTTMKLHTSACAKEAAAAHKQEYDFECI